MKRWVPMVLVATLAWGALGCSRSTPTSDGARRNQGAPRAEKPQFEKTATAAREATGDEKPPASSDGAAAAMPADRILLVIVDALRADRLGCYGFDKPTSPTIDAIAAHGVRFASVHAASPWTAPSFGTLFTGVSPSVHGGGAMLPRKGTKGTTVHGVRVQGLRADLPTVAALMPDRMVTAAVINNSFLSPSLGYDRGFDRYDFRNAHLRRYRTADETTQAAIAQLDAIGDKPFFLVVHYFDPHIQYGPPKRYIPLFATGPPGRVQYPFVDHRRARDHADWFTQSEKEYIAALYQAEVRYVDDALGRLVAAMRKRGLWDRTWVIITSDHGEEHFDHGSFDHGHRFEEEVTRVPLIVRAPSGAWHAGDVVPWNVSHKDVAPTLLEIAGGRSPAHFEGTSLLPLVHKEQEGHRWSYMEYTLFWGPKDAYFDGRYKVIRNLRTGRAWMYDLQEDPAEHRRLGEDHPAFAGVRARCASIAEALQARKASPGAGAALSEDQERALRSLGYIQ